MLRKIGTVYLESEKLRVWKVSQGIRAWRTNGREWWQMTRISGWKMILYSEITTTYYELAKVHHPDHGGDQATFLQIHKGLVFDGIFDGTVAQTTESGGTMDPKLSSFCTVYFGPQLTAVPSHQINQNKHIGSLRKQFSTLKSLLKPNFRIEWFPKMPFKWWGKLFTSHLDF